MDWIEEGWVRGLRWFGQKREMKLCGFEPMQMQLETLFHTR